jgi:hypothetical protein
MFKVIDKEGKGAIIFINQYTSPEKTLKRLNNLGRNSKTWKDYKGTKY